MLGWRRLLTVPFTRFDWRMIAGRLAQIFRRTELAVAIGIKGEERLRSIGNFILGEDIVPIDIKGHNNC